MTHTEALKPCPFCGSTNLSTEDARDFVACGDCYTEGPCNPGQGSAVNIEAWNRRALSAPAAPEPVAMAPEREPLGTVRYWLGAYSDPKSGPHFMGHGMVVAMLRDYLTMREAEATPAAPSVPSSCGLTECEGKPRCSRCEKWAAAPSVPAGWRLDVDPSLKWVSIINAQSQCGQDFYPDRDPLVFAFLRDLAAPQPGAPTPTAEGE